MAKQLLFADSMPGPVGIPHYTWMDKTMQDLCILGPWLHWPKLAEAGA